MVERTAGQEAGDAEWDEFVAAHPDGHHEQSSAHGANRAGFAFRCDRVVVREGGRIVGGAQVLARRTPIGVLALVLRAPLAQGDDPRLLDRVVGELDALAARRSYACLRVELFPTQLAALQALERGGHRESDAWFGERPSLVLPLALSDSELLGGMKPKGRYNVRLAERSGITVRSAGAEGLDAFYALHQMTAGHQGFPIYPREYFDTVWKLFAPAGRMRLFLAYLGEQPIAGILNTIVGARMYYGWGGMSREPAHRRLMPNYLLHYRAAQWARERGCTHYDLVGVTEFKEKLSREAIHWPRPRWKHYGPLRVLRRAAAEFSWSSALARRAVRAAARRLDLLPRLPY